MQIKFYAAKKTAFSHAIYYHQSKRLKLKEKYAINTHVEAFFSDGMMYGSSEVDGGVRKKYMREFKDHWNTIDLGLKDREEKFCRDWLESKIGKEYDRAGIVFAQAFKTNWFLRPDKYFCSELVVEMMQELLKSDIISFATFKRYKNFVGITPHMISPAELYQILEK